MRPSIQVYSHAVGIDAICVKRQETFSTLCKKSFELYSTYFPGKEYPKDWVEARWNQLIQAVSPVKQLVLQNLPSGFLWESYWGALKEKYPQCVWLSVFEEQSRYSFEFIPLSVQKEGFPFQIQLETSLQQQGVLEGNEEYWKKELLELLEREAWERNTRKTEDSINERSSFQEDEKASLTETIPFYSKQQFYSGETLKQLQDRLQKMEEKNRRLLEENQQLEEETGRLRQLSMQKLKNQVQMTKQTSFSLEEKEKLQAEILQERNSKERLRLTNKKLEVLLAQMEQVQFQQAVEVLSSTATVEDWSKVHKIELREYTGLLQKARFLEKVWEQNQSLVEEVERLSVSGKEASYERTKTQKLKNRLNNYEIYLLLDESQSIEKRTKLKRSFFGRKPYVRILHMDYESLQRQAAYFDLVQGENTFLEETINTNKEKKKQTKNRKE